MFRRMNTSNADRPVDLKAGDTIVCIRPQGYLGVVHPDGSHVDLNQLIMAAGSTGGCIRITEGLNVLALMHLASCLAVTYGLSSNSARQAGGGVIVCPVTEPHEEASDELPPAVQDFIRKGPFVSDETRRLARSA